jgi:ATP-dependent Clp protease ATP-binding subunit ClpA
VDFRNTIIIMTSNVGADSVIVFRALNREDIQKIVSLELNKVAERLVENNIRLRATDAAVQLLAELGYDPDMGARPLRRVIQSKIEDRFRMRCWPANSTRATLSWWM